MADPIFLRYKDGATISQKEKFVTIIVLVEKKTLDGKPYISTI